MKWFVDTDVLIDYLRGCDQAIEYLHKLIRSRCLISAVTVAELYRGVKGDHETRILQDFIAQFEVIAIDNEVAKIAGLYQRDYGKSHGVELADALIAASSEFCEAKLVTLNKKHFPMLKNIVMPYHKS